MVKKNKKNNVPNNAPKEKKEKTKKKSTTKNRNIYALSTDIFHSDDSFSTTSHGWNKKLCDDLVVLIQKINSFPMQEKCLKDPLNNSWILYLNNVTLEDKIKPTYLKGYFHSTVDGLRTDVLNLETNKIKPNPKEKGDNEIQTTCFALRFSDGLFLLGDYGANLVKPSKISDYLTTFAKKLGTVNNMNQIALNYLVSKDFLEKLNSFKKLNTLELTIDTTQISGNEDAISSLNEETQKTNQKNITLVLKQKDKLGLIPDGVYNWVSDTIKNHTVTQGKIKGSPNPGNPNEIKLGGINEKYPKSFELDDKGEVLTEDLFNSLIKILGDRAKLQ